MLDNQSFAPEQTTFGSVEELYRAVRAVAVEDHSNVVFTVLNWDYIQIGRLWVQFMRKAGVSNFFVVCTDEECERVLKSEGVSTLLVTPENEKSRDALTLKGSTFANDYAVFVVSLKFQIMARLLELGWDAVFSDVDALWLKNPLKYFSKVGADIMFQPASFPDSVKKKWGFTVCTGLLSVKTSSQTVQLFETAQMSFAGSDQAALNNVLIRYYDIEWAQRPTRWEHCHVFRGWRAPIRGTCGRSGVTFAALPHSRFQRHNVNRISTRYALVCHPNSPKSEPGKLQIFRHLGLI